VAYEILNSVCSVMEERILAVMEVLDNASANPVDYMPRKARRDYSPRTLFDTVTCFGTKMSLPRQLETENQMRAYLAMIIIDAMHQAGDTLVYPHDMNTRPVSMAEFESTKLELAQTSYSPFGNLTNLGTGEDEAALRAKALQ
jgi:hypothetical protein